MRTVLTAAMVATLVMGRAPAASPALTGTWALVSRIDRNAAGAVLSESSLGSLPIGYLIYDNAGHVAAQLSARDRSGRVCDSSVASPDPNNNANIAGYSAYFGRYEIDATAGVVTHIVTGTLLPTDIGKRMARHFAVVGDTLTVWFEPMTADGTTRHRTLVWHRTGR